MAQRPEPPGELLLREARAADLLVIGRRHSRDDADPGVILLRSGRPVLLVPDTIAALPLRRVVVGWKDTRDCRRAVRDALPFLQQAKEVLLVEIGEDESQAQAKTMSRPSPNALFRCGSSERPRDDR
jgi:hypothetical protein